MLRANPKAWLDTVSRFGFKLRLAAGRVANIRNFADRLGRRWLQGAANARVTLDKRNKIFLGPGVDFQVTDGNACDGNSAAFTLPADIATAWEVYIRELGKPGGSSDITTCGISAGTDGVVGTDDDEVICSTNSVEFSRKSGKSMFRNYTTELTTVTYQIPILDQYGNVIGYAEDTAALFDPDFYQYFWDYYNNGLRLVQLRFYPKQ